MKTEHEYWTIENLRSKINQIEFPEFQREPTVWNLEKKKRLIDSILRDFDISSIYFHKKEDGGFDCIDGRQRINAILSYLGINDADEYHNKFNLEVQNEIFNDGRYFVKVNGRRFENLPPDWQTKILEYRLNIVIVTEVTQDEELNLLFLRLQIASVLNAGEKLHAMTGQMRDWIFLNIKDDPFFKEISIPKRRYAREQVAAQIVLNVYSLEETQAFHRSRYVDMQDFLKEHARFGSKEKRLNERVMRTLHVLTQGFGQKLKCINNRALAVSVCLFVDRLINAGREREIDKFSEFLIKLLKTLKWQVPKGVDMDRAYHDLLRFQTNITQAAPEKYAIERRHSFLDEYFRHFNESKEIKGDTTYSRGTHKDPDKERRRINL